MACLRQQVELPRPTNVLGLPIRPFTADGLIGLIVERARLGLRTSVCYANAHTVNLAWKDARYRAVLCDCDVLYADGTSVVWASHWSERPLPRRLTAADTFPRFARRCAGQGLSLYLLGGRSDVVDRAAERLRGKVPDLKIVGTHHGYFDDGESPRVVADIRAARPDVLVVGMSSPRQEFWMAEHAGALDVPVHWCVGALFDVLAGAEPRAPAWLCGVGGEWLFRLLADPVGKWRRYLVGNPLFVWHALRWRMGRSSGGRLSGAADAAKG